MRLSWKKVRDNAVSVAFVLSYATLCIASCVFEPFLSALLLSIRWVLPANRIRCELESKLKKTEKDVFTALESLCGLSKLAQIERRALETRILQDLNSAVHLDTSARRNSYTLLQYAIGADSERVVLALLRRGGNVLYASETSECSSPLFLAIRNKNLRIFETLLKAGANANAPCACLCFPDSSSCKFLNARRATHGDAAALTTGNLVESLRMKKARANAQMQRTWSQLGAALSSIRLFRSSIELPHPISFELIAGNYVDFLEVFFNERRVAELCDMPAYASMLRCAALNGSFDCFRFLLRTQMRADACSSSTIKSSLPQCIAEQVCTIVTDCYHVQTGNSARNSDSWRNGLSIVHIIVANERCNVTWLHELVNSLESCHHWCSSSKEPTAIRIFSSGTTRHETVFHLLADRLQVDHIAALQTLEFIIKQFGETDTIARNDVLNRYDAVGQTALHRVLLCVNRDRDRVADTDGHTYLETVQRFLEILLANGADPRLGELPLNTTPSVLETLRFTDASASQRSAVVSCVHILLRGSLRALPTDISLPDALSTDRDLLLSSTEYIADFDALADALSALLRTEARVNAEALKSGSSPTKSTATATGQVSELANGTVNGQSAVHVLLGSLRKCGPRALANQFGEPFVRCLRVLIEHGARLDFSLPNKQGTCVSLVSAVGEAFVLEFDNESPALSNANATFISLLLRTLLRGGMPANVCSEKRAVFLNGGVGNALIEFVRCAQFARSVHSLRAVRDWLSTLLTHGADPDREAYRCEPTFVHSQSNMFIREQRTFAVSHLLHFVPLLLTLPEPHTNAIDDVLTVSTASQSHARLTRDAAFARCVCELLNLFAFTMRPSIFGTEMSKLRNRLVNDIRRLLGASALTSVISFEQLLSDSERRCSSASASNCSAELCIKQHLLRLFTQPLTLKQLCRSTLTRLLDHRPAERVESLPLPESIKHYLCVPYLE